ncbi:MAG: hypothetical protein QOE97_1565 [Pseudonocardiales bacterium]|nr:hypothetical protein [Pseudonocardiales bacterium]
MSVTVVTVRDDNGAPSAREMYADGARYTIGGGDLEIISATSHLLGLYPSGNWLSVYMDDSVIVASGPPEYTGRAAPASGTADDPTAQTDDPQADDPHADDPQADAGVDATAGSPPDVEPVEPAARFDAAQPVTGETDHAVEAVETVRDLPEPTEVPPALPPGMRAVVFRPRVYKIPPSGNDKPADRRHSQLRPVVVRPKASPVPPKQEERPAENEHPGMRPVVFRGRAYRAAQTRSGPSSPEAASPERDDPDGEEPGGDGRLPAS